MTKSNRLAQRDESLHLDFGCCHEEGSLVNSCKHSNKNSQNNQSLSQTLTDGRPQLAQKMMMQVQTMEKYIEAY